MADSTADTFIAPERPVVDAAAIREVIEQREAFPLDAYESESRVDWFRLWNAWLMVALGFVEALLAFRLGFLLAGANPQNGFVDLVYHFSKPLVAPFNGIIAPDKLGTTGVIEPSILVAMVVYIVAAVLTVSIAWAITMTGNARMPRTRAL
ncbi:MAG TPA: hypothetical protein VH951_04155 [Dehalococcoidia bacterium]|jgi:hypothetical protein